jgi:hypothetical protein
MALLAVQQVSKSGVADVSAALAAADVAGDSVKASSGLLIVMENGDAGSHTLTITRPSATIGTGAYGDADIEDIVLTVAAGKTGQVVAPQGYRNANNEYDWDYDDVTSVKIGVFSLSNG